MIWQFAFDLPDVPRWVAALVVLGFSAFFAFYINPAIVRVRNKKN